METIVDGLQRPWGMAQLPDGSWLITEKRGRLRLVSKEGNISAPISGLPSVDSSGQGGLLDVAVQDDFDNTGRLWWSFSEPRSRGRSSTSVATGVLSKDRTTISDATVIFRQNPAWASSRHFGSRLVFDKSGALFITTGDRGTPRTSQMAQDPKTHIGKVLRIDPLTGEPKGATDNKGFAPEVWSYGHRNMQSATLGPDGNLWTIEHGPRGGDELNRPQMGKNYGWPVITYGETYSGRPVGKGQTQMKGMEQPLYYWDPVIAPSGMAFSDPKVFPEWKTSILVGGLASQSLIRLEMDRAKVKGENRYLEGMARIRDVATGNDGALYILTDSNNGALIRITPK
ncbi:PQQ-dependent sugar dehydrogenase [Pseudovibrio flavus]|uniref:PQQ-dependent sugar dehydrogenase n=1 Tax=Pseudovibrio flavus TaxID=2529854 RepID=UPI00211CC434|nr:PQQ-dependent sugar dehydrogenase [Pseudovibrio flavus]